MVAARFPGTIGHEGVALAFAFIVCSMIYTLGHVSGAHINPAVTIAFWSLRRFPRSDVLPYVFSQCVGAILAAFALSAIVGPFAAAAATVPRVSIPAAFGLEWLLSFVLMFVVTAVATDDRVASGFAGLAVGLTVGMDAMMGGPLTGASMNPARSLGPAVASAEWNAHWVYWVAPISAMIVAARVYNFVKPADAIVAGTTLGVEGQI
jgi:MIP family channel proteins